MSCGNSGSLYDLAGNAPKDTYHRLVQIDGSGNLYDGNGTLITEIYVENQATKCFSIAMAITLG